MKTKIAIIGGGASGLATAIFAAEEALARQTPVAIDVYEGAKKWGLKILVSGGGRCNLTHQEVSAQDYHGATNNIRRVLRGFDHLATQKWFTQMGVPLKTESTGKIFPRSDRAQDVVDALIGRARALGIGLHLGHRVQSLQPQDGGFLLNVIARDGPKQVQADAVVIAAGGQALPKSGSDGAGLALARALGHKPTKTHPALVGLTLAEGGIHQALQGVTAPVELSLWAENKRRAKYSGDILFTHFGISGPVALDISHDTIALQEEKQTFLLTLNLFPNMDMGSVDQDLIARAKGNQKGVLRLVEEWAPHLPTALIKTLIAQATSDAALAFDETVACHDLKKASRRAIAAALTQWPLKVIGHRGWHRAEVTAGGVPFSELDRQLQSKCCPGVYFVGEVIDCDGRLGGFNFQWAFASGHCVGQAVVRGAGKG